MSGCSGTRPAELGLRVGKLRPCPATPNCVSSEAGTPAEQTTSAFSAPEQGAMQRLAALVTAWPRTSIVTTTPEYLHAEVTTKLMRFVDDVEFRYDSATKLIHVRSASRIGRKDFGVNRERVNAMRAKWDAR